MSKTRKEAIFAESRNRIFRKDGDEFLREASKYIADLRDLGVRNGDIYSATLTSTGRDPAKYISLMRDINVISFFCHGSSKSLIGAQSNIWSVNKMADAIKLAYNGEGITIKLFTCSTGKGDIYSFVPGRCPPSAGYAMRLADCLAMRDVDFMILAHDRSGHTTRNPHKLWVYKSTMSNHVKKTYINRYVSAWAGRKYPEARANWLDWVDRCKTSERFLNGNA